MGGMIIPRSVEIEITRYSDRLEIDGPGALPNSMDVAKMKAGRRTPRNPLLLEVLRDYGYVDARGMGVRLKLIPQVLHFTGRGPENGLQDDILFLQDDGKELDYDEKSLGKYRQGVGKEGGVGTECGECLLEKGEGVGKVSEKILAAVRERASITIAELAIRIELTERTIERYLQKLRQQGRLRRVGGRKQGHWEVIEQ